MLHFLFTQPHLELLIKDHRSQAAVGVSGHVHGYKIIVTYAGLMSEAQRKSFVSGAPRWTFCIFFFKVK